MIKLQPTLLIRPPQAHQLARNWQKRTHEYSPLYDPTEPEGQCRPVLCPYSRIWTAKEETL